MHRPEAAAAARERRLLPGAGAAVGVQRCASRALGGSSKLMTNAAAARSRHDLAAAAADYRELAALQAMSADTWADYADVTAGLNGNSLAGEPEKYLQEALRLDPQHPEGVVA